MTLRRANRAQLLAGIAALMLPAAAAAQQITPPPAGTPKPVIARLNKALQQALATEAVQRRLAELGVEPAPSSPDEFAALVKQQAGLWGKVIQDAHIRLEP